MSQHVNDQRPRRFLPGLRAIALVLLLTALLPGMDRAARATQSAENDACAAFNSRVWAQSAFDEEPVQRAQLDPDHDGLACEALPPGIAPALWTGQIPENAIPIDLKEVVDGDTIEATINGRSELVRLVGIDTREVDGPYQDAECFGPEASDFLTRLLAIGGELALEEDQEDRDQYGRLLRWVWVDFGTGEVYLLNESLIRAGYAERFRDTPNRRYVDELIEAEAFARRHDFGLWGACDAGPAQPAEPAGNITPDSTAPAAGERAGCDAAYPDVCIPPPPPDLECRDVPETHFRVLPPDPHHFDGNMDGVACEGPR